MNKSEFIQAMAEKSDLSVKDATAALNARSPYERASLCPLLASEPSR